MLSNYNPNIAVTFIRDLLQKAFESYGGDLYKWDEDARKSQIVIGTVNDFNEISRIQQTPRVIISRGPLQMSTQFLRGFERATGGIGVSSGDEEINRQDVNAQMTIIVEARNEGTCEEIAEFLRRFFCWSRLHLEKRFGFREFGKQMSVSECIAGKEDDEKFKINISIPYAVEERWKVSGDLTRLNHIFNSLAAKN